MTQLPTISIVTPSLNQGQFIGEALESVRSQDYPALEHLVLDGGSNDGTVELLRERSLQQGWEHLRWSSAKDRGQSDALNRGFSETKGEIIGWLNSDDRYRAGCFRRVAQTFAKNPSVHIVYGDTTWIDNTGTTTRVRREIGLRRFVLLYHRVLYIPTAATFFRRTIFEDAFRLDDNLQYAMDFDFFLRLAIAGHNFKHISALLADFRFHPASKSCATREEQLREHDEVVHRHSRLLRKVESPHLRSSLLASLRVAAAFLRYFEKGIHGYYFDYLRETCGSSRSATFHRVPGGEHTPEVVTKRS